MNEENERRERQYVAIDLKSFYASVECVERGLDPLTTNLTVADVSRTEKTICLAVSPSLKKYGISGRARLFEVVQRIKEVNIERSRAVRGALKGESFDDTELQRDKSLSVAYITAVPRMALYIEYSKKIYNIYLNFAAPEDIHVYSIDEVFIDVTAYLALYGMTARELTERMINEVLAKTGITATAGIGTNLYLCKIAMDISAKHMKPDANGVRIAELDEASYRRTLWSHTPLTDFWRVGRGYASKLEERGIRTMGDIARCSIGGEKDYYNEELLYRMFGINAELLIDHAWGWEPCTIADIKAYKPSTSSISSGQVLQSPYPFDRARIVLREMTELLILELVEKRLVTDRFVVTIGYDTENLQRPEIRSAYKGAVVQDRYGRRIPKQAHGTVRIGARTSSTKRITKAVLDWYDNHVGHELLVRRITVAAINLADESSIAQESTYEKLDLFTNYEEQGSSSAATDERERKMQEAILNIKKRYGRNAVLKGMNLQDDATAISRNEQIGGHKA